MTKRRGNGQTTDMRPWSRDVLFAATLAVTGCGGQKVDLGGTDGGSGASGSDAAAVPVDAMSTSEAQTFPEGPPYEYVDAGFSPNGGEDATVPVPEGGTSLGRFVGYFENYTLPSGSDAVFVNLAEGADGKTVVGVAVLGSGTPPPPPTQPDVGYPPGFSPQTGSGIIEGYAYTVLQGQLAGSRLTFGVDEEEPWGEWCEIQTSFPQTGGADTYACIPGGWCQEVAGGPPNGSYGTCGIRFCLDGGPPGPVQPIDCGQAALCGVNTTGIGVCTCTASGCSHPLVANNHFDLQVTSMHLDGSVSGLPHITGNVNVHLTQQ
jgi:hypothetical protein